MDSSYITVSAERVVELTTEAIECLKVNTENEYNNMLKRVEKAMRQRRWWNKVGPWYTSEGPPSEDQIDLWIRQTMGGSRFSWVFYHKKDYERQLERSIEKLERYFVAAKDGDPFLLTLADYNYLAGIS
jgi:hypothetical protein